MDKNKIFETIGSLNIDYMSFNYNSFDDNIKKILTLLEDKFIVMGGTHKNILSMDDEIMLRSTPVVYNFNLTKQNLYQKYFSDINVYMNINNVVCDKLLLKIQEVRDYKNKYNSDSINNTDELNAICISLNKLVFQFKIPNTKTNVSSILMCLYSFIYKSESLTVDVIEKTILDLKSIYFIMDCEKNVIGINGKNNEYYLKGRPNGIVNEFYRSLEFSSALLNDDFIESINVSSFKKIFLEFIPKERLEYLSSNPRNSIISPVESEVKGLSREEQASFVKNRVFDFCFAVRMVFLKDYIFNKDKASLENYYILIINSYNRLVLVLRDNNRL